MIAISSRLRVPHRCIGGTFATIIFHLREREVLIKKTFSKLKNFHDLIFFLDCKNLEVTLKIYFSANHGALPHPSTGGHR